LMTGRGRSPGRAPGLLHGGRSGDTSSSPKRSPSARYTSGMGAYADFDPAGFRGRDSRVDLHDGRRQTTGVPVWRTLGMYVSLLPRVPRPDVQEAPIPGGPTLGGGRRSTRRGACAEVVMQPRRPPGGFRTRRRNKATSYARRSQRTRCHERLRTRQEDWVPLSDSVWFSLEKHSNLGDAKGDVSAL